MQFHGTENEFAKPNCQLALRQEENFGKLLVLEKGFLATSFLPSVLLCAKSM